MSSYIPTPKEESNDIVFRHVVDPVYITGYNQGCPSIQLLNCKSINTSKDVIDNETQLIRGIQSYGVIQSAPDVSVVSSPCSARVHTPFQEQLNPEYSNLRLKKSCNTVSIHENQRDVDVRLYPTPESQLHRTTPYAHPTSLFGTDSRQAMKYSDAHAPYRT